jgi:hypothetical protein
MIDVRRKNLVILIRFIIHGGVAKSAESANRSASKNSENEVGV